MNCPVCKTARLSFVDMDSDLKALACPQCQGRWVQSYQYWKWHDKHGSSLPEIPLPADRTLPVTDSHTAKLCPECGHFLTRFPVGHGLEFGLDRCGNCGGMWFDRNEWEILKNRNLHDNVHLIFSAIWQDQIKTELQIKSRENFYKTKFGPSDYQKIKEIKSWIDQHPLASELYAFLKNS
jgi:Zn-finger nucleic acid-binding protein